MVVAENTYHSCYGIRDLKTILILLAVLLSLFTASPSLQAAGTSTTEEKTYCDTAHKNFLSLSTQAQHFYLNQLLFGSVDKSLSARDLTTKIKEQHLDSTRRQFTFNSYGANCANYNNGILGQLCFLIAHLEERKLNFTRIADVQSRHEMFQTLVDLETEVPTTIKKIESYNCYADSIGRDDLRIDFFYDLSEIPANRTKNLTPTIIASAYLKTYAEYIAKVSNTIAIDQIPPKHAKATFQILAEQVERSTGFRIACDTLGTKQVVREPIIIVTAKNRIKESSTTTAETTAGEYPEIYGYLSDPPLKQYREVTINVPDYLKCVYSTRQIMAALYMPDINVVSFAKESRYISINETGEATDDYRQKSLSGHASRQRRKEERDTSYSPSADQGSIADNANSIFLEISWRNDFLNIGQKLSWLQKYDPTDPEYQKINTAEQEIRKNIQIIQEKYPARFKIDYNSACTLSDDHTNVCVGVLRKLDKLLSTRDKQGRALLLDHPHFQPNFRIQIDLAGEYTDWVNQNVFRIGSNQKDTYEYIVASLERGTMVGRFQTAGTPMYNNLGALPSIAEMRRIRERAAEKRRAELLLSQARLYGDTKPPEGGTPKQIPTKKITVASSETAKVAPMKIVSQTPTAAPIAPIATSPTTTPPPSILDNPRPYGYLGNSKSGVEQSPPPPTTKYQQAPTTTPTTTTVISSPAPTAKKRPTPPAGAPTATPTLAPQFSVPASKLKQAPISAVVPPPLPAAAVVTAPPTEPSKIQQVNSEEPSSFRPLFNNYFKQ